MRRVEIVKSFVHVADGGNEYFEIDLHDAFKKETRENKKLMRRKAIEAFSEALENAIRASND